MAVLVSPPRPPVTPEDEMADDTVGVVEVTVDDALPGVDTTATGFPVGVLPQEAEPRWPSDRSRLMTVALMAVTVTGATRLISGFSWLLPVYAAAVVTAVVHRSRETNRRPAPTVNAMAAGGLMAAAMVAAPLFAAGTFTDSIGRLPGEAFDALLRDQAPVAATPGATFGLAVLVVASMGWMLRQPPRRVFAVVAVPAVWFVSLSTAAAKNVGGHNLVYAAVVTGVVLCWWATQRVESCRDESVRRSVFRHAVPVAAAATIIGVVVAPHLPGADEPALWPMFRTRNSSTVSPLVQIGGKITQQTTIPMFTVTGDRPVPSYWRLTALDEFNGRSWFAGPNQDRLPGSQPAGEPTVFYTFTIQGLSGDLLPGPVNAKVTGSNSVKLQWGPGEVRDAYRMPDRAVTYPDRTYTLGATSRPDDSQIRERATTVANVDMAPWTGLPDGFDQSYTARIVREVTDGTTGFDALARLERWFATTFTYTLGADYTHESDPIASFLTRKTGYCQQFAGTFAAMARLLGFPARVAIGFTAGAADPTTPNRWNVMGGDAHAWPEVWFGPELGWVPFEPTPTRVVNQPTVAAPTTTPVPSTTPTTSAAPDTATVNEPKVDLETVGTSRPADVDQPRPSLQIDQVAVAVGWLIVLFTVFALTDRVRSCLRHRQRRHRPPSDQMLTVWEDILRRVATTGAAKLSTETNTAWAARTQQQVPSLTGLVDTAEKVDAVLFGTDPQIDVGDVDDAEDVLGRVMVAAVTHPVFVKPRRSTGRRSGWSGRLRPGQVVVAQEPVTVT